MTKGKVDWILFAAVILLVSVGLFFFSSASLGVLAKNEAKFYSILANQLLLGLGLGTFAMLVLSRIPYRTWKRPAILIFIFTLLLTSLVFVPGIGFEHNGATRWVAVGTLSLQPSEFLKFGFILFLAAWFTSKKDKVGDIKFGVVPFAIALSTVALIMLKQPDTGTFLVMAATALSMFFLAGARFRDLSIFVILGIAGLILLVAFKPYIKERLLTYIDPTNDPHGSSYQIQQSLIAIGSGEIFGRGIGQSVQKFSYLPEPAGDSIFAVIGEEIGFVGGGILVSLFALFILRGLKVAHRVGEPFGGLLASGIVLLIAFQAFLNIASLSGIFPLTGIPLPFMSHGGTALFITLAEIGILLNISRYAGR